MEREIRIARLANQDMRRMIYMMKLYNPETSTAFYERVNNQVDDMLTYLEERRMRDG